jgi:hypothetical protein
MLNNFRDYLLSERAAKANYVPYYVKWVGDCYSFLNISDASRLSSDQKNQFLSHMAKSYEDWQVKQADTALRLHDYFLSRQQKAPASKSNDSDSDWLSVEEKMRTALRLRHLAYSTEKTYLLWLRSFRAFIKEKDPVQLLENGYDIRTIQELLGHANLQTTMIYTHVATKNILGVKSPLDK